MRNMPIKTKEQMNTKDYALEELLSSAEGKERERLLETWKALDLESDTPVAPKPCAELRAIFESSADDRLDDSELDMLAAAGIVSSGSSPDSPVAGLDVASGESGRTNRDRAGDALSGGETGVSLENDPLYGPNAGEPGKVRESGSEPVSEGPSEEGDTFVVGGGSGETVIADFDPVRDRLIIQGLSEEMAVSQSQDGSATILTCGEQVIILEGVKIGRNQLTRLCSFVNPG